MDDTKNMWVFIPTGGSGTRLLPYTENRTKPMVPLINNFPIIEFILYGLAGIGFKQFVFGTKGLKQYQDLHSYFQGGSGWSAKLNITPQVHFEYQDPNYLDSGSADSCLYNINRLRTKQSVLVVQGDNLFHPYDVLGLIGQANASPFLATIGLHPTNQPQFFGIAEIASNYQITSFTEKPTQVKSFSPLANTGIYLIKPKAYKYLSGDFGKNSLPYLASRHALSGYILKHPWYNLDTPQQHLTSVLQLLNDPLPPIENYITRIHTRVTTKSGQVWIRGKSQYSQHFIKPIIKAINQQEINISGIVIIGKNCLLGKNVKLYNCSIGDLSTVGNDTTISSSNISDCWQIGNKVLIDNSFLGRGGKVVNNRKIKDKFYGENTSIE